MEQQNKYHVIVSERATQMLVSHAANSLELMPQRCPWLIGEYIPRNAYRFILFEKRYMIIFQIVDDIVYADYVVDCRQDYSWLIR